MTFCGRTFSPSQLGLEGGMDLQRVYIAPQIQSLLLTHVLARRLLLILERCYCSITA
jgi:hypothetical protein